jgi:superfamily II DNA or RNA helicase
VEAQIPLYSEYYYGDSKQKVTLDVEPKKLQAALYHKEEYNHYMEHTKHRFIFQMPVEYVGRGQRFYIGNDHVLHLDNRSLRLHSLTPLLARLIQRLELRSRYEEDGARLRSKEFFEARLTADDICRINDIIRDGKEYMDFQTALEPDYAITKYSNADSVLEVDYDATEESLSIRPIVDYVCWRNNVSETVYLSSKYGRKTVSYRGDPKQSDSSILVLKEKSISCAQVKSKKEKQLFRLWSGKYGFNQKAAVRLSGQKAIFNFYKDNWPSIQKLADNNVIDIQFVKDRFNFVSGDFKADFKVDLDAANDWLYFDLNCYCGNDQLSIADLRIFIDSGKEFMKLNDGRLLRISNREELERLVLMLESFEAREQGGFEGRLYHAPELEYVVTSSAHYNAKLKNSFTKFIKEAQSGRPVKRTKLAPHHDKLLRKYQKSGIDWFHFLLKYRFAGVLADDMGLGKTIQTLILLDMMKTNGKPSLVICPKTLVYNWQAEAAKFTPNLKVAVVDGMPAERRQIIRKAKDYDLLITGYASHARDEEIYKKHKIIFNYAILDEAQFIKNHVTKNSQIVKKVNADYRLALTGTPLENSVSEIWSIFDFLMPGFLGSYKAFVKKFHNPIMKRSNAEALQALKRKTEYFMLRRTKQEVLKELPPKVEQTKHCRLGKAQNLLYQEILARVKGEVLEAVEKRGFNRSRIQILAGLTKLRQVCNHPVLLLKDKKYTAYESAKLEAFEELIDEIVGGGKKVLVFSQFTTMLDILSDTLKKRGVEHLYLSGKTRNRQELVEKFNADDNIPVFLISMKAGGTGLNLTAADNVVIFDPWWNPSVENQAIDRAHRIGQTRAVNVYKFVTDGTIEEKIVALQAKKKYLFDNLVGESKDVFQKLTWEDIKGLFV